MKKTEVIKIELEDSEVSALQTIARIDCVKIDCDDCPLQTKSGECVKGYVKRMLIDNEITW